MNNRYKYYEFFCGGGMARLGLGKKWDCVFANDFCPKKVEAYRRAFGPSPELLREDIRQLRSEQLPDGAVLAWASFPCQDLSLAGKGRGLEGERSSTFWPFLDLILAKNADREVPIIAVENVVGTITSDGGKDFAAILGALKAGGYRYGALVIDARMFVPQSRPRLFIVAVSSKVQIPRKLVQEDPFGSWHSPSLIRAYHALPEAIRKDALWWRVPLPEGPAPQLRDVLEENPLGVRWHYPSETEAFVKMMSHANLQKLFQAQAMMRRTVGTLYRRTRTDEHGNRNQRAEVRFDQISGCLRTPAGGSSRQTIVVVEGDRIRSRLLSPREAARLMGAPDDYPLPTNYNEAYKLMGDGLVVPVVSWLSKHVLVPLAQAASREKAQDSGRRVA